MYKSLHKNGEAIMMPKEASADDAYDFEKMLYVSVKEAAVITFEQIAKKKSSDQRHQVSTSKQRIGLFINELRRRFSAVEQPEWYTDEPSWHDYSALAKRKQGRGNKYDGRHELSRVRTQLLDTRSWIDVGELKKDIKVGSVSAKFNAAHWAEEAMNNVKDKDPLDVSDSLETMRQALIMADATVDEARKINEESSKVMGELCAIAEEVENNNHHS